MWGLSNTATQRNGKREGITSRPAWNFVRHLLEMVLAMAAGMMLLGGLVSLLELALGQPEAFDLTSVEALDMTVNMTIGMGLWMRHRGHNLPHIAEMAGAMFMPLAVLIYPFWAGLITEGALMGAMHVLMLPAMVGVMLFRRDIYTQHHRHHVPSIAPRYGTSPARSAMSAPRRAWALLKGDLRSMSSWVPWRYLRLRTQWSTVTPGKTEQARKGRQFQG